MAKPDLCDRSLSLLFQGLHLLCWASLLHEEVQCLETEGLPKVEMAVAGSEAEGLYKLLRGALSHSPMSFASPLLKDVTRPLPPPFLSCPLRSLGRSTPNPLLLQLREMYWYRRLPLVISQALRLPSPHTWHPYVWMWGASKGFTSARLRGAAKDCPHIQQPFALTCARCIWVWGWAVPPAPELSSTQMLLGITKRKVIPNSLCHIN